jgi:hypothetical protein
MNLSSNGLTLEMKDLLAYLALNTQSSAVYGTSPPDVPWISIGYHFIYLTSYGYPLHEMF